MTQSQKYGLGILIIGIILSIVGLTGIKKTNGTGYHWSLAVGLVFIGVGGTLLVNKSQFKL